MRPQPAGEEQPSTQGQASGCPSPDAAPPHTVAGETGCFHPRVLVGLGPLGSRGWRGPPHSVPEKKMCVSIQNGSFTGNQTPAGVSLGPGSPHSPPTWHRGRWEGLGEGLGVGPHLAAPPSPANCHKMVVLRHSLWRADKEAQQAAYEEAPWPEGRGGRSEEHVENRARETESGRRQAHLLQNRLSQLPQRNHREVPCATAEVAAGPTCCRRHRVARVLTGPEAATSSRTRGLRQLPVLCSCLITVTYPT